MAGETCWEKVEDAAKALADTLAVTAGPIEGWLIDAGRSRSDAVDPDTPSVVIATVSIRMEEFTDLSSTLHTQVIEFEFIEGNAPAGTLRRANLRKAAALHAAIAADRTLGGMLHDIQEVDIAPAAPEGRDVNGVSVQYNVQFFTPRDDWLTILGQAGNF